MAIYVRWIVLAALTVVPGRAEQAPPASPPTVQTLSGDSYERARVVRKANGWVTLSHAGGILTVAASNLTSESRALLRIRDQEAGAPAPAVEREPASVPCATCNGARSIVCPSCRGGKFGQDVVERVKCATCDGRGRVPKSKTLFEYGGGGGKRNRHFKTTSHEPCAKCDGSGKLNTTKRVYCPSCHGSGSVPCPTCPVRL